MSERPKVERGFARRTLDKVTYGISFITLPLGVVTAGASVTVGSFTTAAIAGGFAFMDYTQIKEHGREPEKQSWYNPERIYDRVFGRFQPSSTRMVRAAA